MSKPPTSRGLRCVRQNMPGSIPPPQPFPAAGNIPAHHPKSFWHPCEEHTPTSHAKSDRRNAGSARSARERNTYREALLSVCMMGLSRFILPNRIGKRLPLESFANLFDLLSSFPWIDGGSGGRVPGERAGDRGTKRPKNDSSTVAARPAHRAHRQACRDRTSASAATRTRRCARIMAAQRQHRTTAAASIKVAPA